MFLASPRRVVVDSDFHEVIFARNISKLCIVYFPKSMTRNDNSFILSILPVNVEVSVQLGEYKYASILGCVYRIQAVLRML